MLRINCPFCGTRDQEEFRYGGEAGVVRPARPDSASDAEWAHYLFYRANVRGLQLERWWHASGCRQWFLLARDTATHVTEGAYRMDESLPGQPAAPGSPAG
jgi:sarcosine oxidase subunit delta